MHWFAPGKTTSLAWAKQACNKGCLEVGAVRRKPCTCASTLIIAHVRHEHDALYV